MTENDEMRRETRSCADCEATPDTPDVATITWGKDDSVVTEHHTKECPDYLKRWKPLFDDIRHTRDNNGEETA